MKNGSDRNGNAHDELCQDSGAEALGLPIWIHYNTKG